MGRVEVFIQPLYVLLFWLCVIGVVVFIGWLLLRFIRKKVKVEDLKGLMIVIFTYILYSVFVVIIVFSSHIFLLFLNGVVRSGFLEFLHK